MDYAAHRGTVLAFDDSKGTKAGHAVADRGGMQHVNDLVDVLICVGLFLFKSGSAASAGDDAPFGEFLLN